MKNILSLCCVCLALTSCQTMENVKSGFSNSVASVGGMFSGTASNASDNAAQLAAADCPTFAISDELSYFYGVDNASMQSAPDNLSRAQIQKISGSCRMNQAKNILSTSVTLDFTADMKAGNNDQTVQVPYFVAVLNDNQEIISKETYIIDFQASRENIRHDETIQQNIPLGGNENLSGYTIIAGFQLNDTQLAYAMGLDLQRGQDMEQIMPAAGDSQSNLGENPDPFSGS